jgi:hypothetical protein
MPVLLLAAIVAVSIYLYKTKEGFVSGSGSGARSGSGSGSGSGISLALQKAQTKSRNAEAAVTQLGVATRNISWVLRALDQAKTNKDRAGLIQNQLNQLSRYFDSAQNAIKVAGQSPIGTMSGQSAGFTNASLVADNSGKNAMDKINDVNVSLGKLKASVKDYATLLATTPDGSTPSATLIDTLNKVKIDNYAWNVQIVNLFNLTILNGKVIKLSEQYRP